MSQMTQAPILALNAGCVNCGQVGTLKSVANEITEKKRVKFGLLWVVLTVFTGGIGLLAWLVTPRKNVVTSVDRYNECKSCKTRQ